MKQLAIALLLSLALFGCQAVVETPTGNVVATGDCAADTFTCADGTVVNRNPAYGCEFNPCPSEPDTVIVEDNNPDTVVVTPDVNVDVPAPVVEQPEPSNTEPDVTVDNDVTVNNDVNSTENSTTNTDE